jgi:hypothetical protein
VWRQRRRIPILFAPDFDPRVVSSAQCCSADRRPVDAPPLPPILHNRAHVSHCASDSDRRSSTHHEKELVMIRSAIFIIGIVCATPTLAEWPGQSMAVMQQAYNAAPSLNLLPGAVTPTMRQQKLAQSDALRAEAARMQAADGGTLSAEHVAYIRKQVRQILGQSAELPRTGSLIARN